MNWMHNNELSLNEAKTEFLLFGKKQQLAKVNISHVQFINANIAPLKILGVWLDGTYLWRTISFSLALQLSITSTTLEQLGSTSPKNVQKHQYMLLHQAA